MLIFLLCQVLICALFPADGGNKNISQKHQHCTHQLRGDGAEMRPLDVVEAVRPRFGRHVHGGRHVVVKVIVIALRMDALGSIL